MIDERFNHVGLPILLRTYLNSYRTPTANTKHAEQNLAIQGLYRLRSSSLRGRPRHRDDSTPSLEDSADLRCVITTGKPYTIHIFLWTSGSGNLRDARRVSSASAKVDVAHFPTMARSRLGPSPGE
ncbi:hypothetical protein EVAR_21711_1 [Eumeta japonica]|uniref:Uncharacterized protein n=1 Tax=Eumeta variegata TaxID=151549 RepID=A0A4C1W8T3_EUMVA|nr:hypothetical protein EVAR_21711_1 [Eumeta japonica]